MGWVRFDPGFTQHRKRIDAGPVASWLWVSSVDYCVLYTTDGVLPESAVPNLVPGLANRTRGAAIAALLKTGAWECHPGGYLVHAFLEYQDSAEEVRRQREAGKERARRSRASRGTFTARSPERHAARSPDVRDAAVLSCPAVTATPTPLPPSAQPYRRVDSKTTVIQHGGDVLVNIEE